MEQILKDKLKHLTNKAAKWVIKSSWEDLCHYCKHNKECKQIILDMEEVYIPEFYESRVIDCNYFEKGI